MRHFQYRFWYAVHLKKLCKPHEKSLKYASEPRNDDWFCPPPSIVLKIFDHWGDVLICLLINTSAPSHWLKSVAWPVGPVLKFRDIPDWIKSLKPLPRLVKLNILYSWLSWLLDTWRALHWSLFSESYMWVMYLHFLFPYALGHNILVPLKVMSAVKCWCDILGVVYNEKEDPSARRTLDGRITFHFGFTCWNFVVDCDHVVRYLFDSDQYLLLQLASFVGTVSTLFFGLTTYLGNRTTV